MTVVCSNCAAEMPDGMRFCGNCGHQLEVRCGVCGTPAAMAGQRFCGNCGSPLASAASRPLPAVSSLPLTAGSPTPRERRLVTVLFCDLVGFTPFTEARDPEDVRDVLEHYFAAVSGIVTRYGGSTEKFIGDAVLALWGAPVAHEDDAERAVRTGLGITEAVAALSNRLAIPELRVRVGVLTGEASVDVAAGGRGMLVGDAANTASRLQTAAAPGTVLVDDTTRLASERRIAFEFAGDRELKGKSAAVRTWQALRVLAAAADEAPSTGAALPPMVAREGQLQALKDALAAVLAPGARLALVSVIAEAGLGKSRLAHEFEQHAAGIAAPLHLLRGRVVGFDEGAGLGALAEMVRSCAGIVQGDPPERQRGLVEDLVSGLFERAETLPRDRAHAALARLLGLDDGRARIEQGELFSAWRLVFERLAARHPVVLVFEELQMADQALLQFIAHLLEWAGESPILVIVLSRPDEHIEALAGSGTRLHLPPLSDAEMDQLIGGVVADAPASLLAAVRADGGGVPLFAVETLRALADRGVLAVENGHYEVRGDLGDIAVPPTIHALVASRLDSLGALERLVLNAGAVLGERFNVTGAAAVSGLEETDTRTLLNGLVTKALLAIDDDPRSPLRGSYGFLQGVVRRVTLGTLARRELKRQHLAAADHVAADRRELEPAAALAGHLVAALELEPSGPDVADIRMRAVASLREAAGRAAAIGALEQALSLLDRAAEICDEERERAELLESAGDIARRAGDAQAAADRHRAAAAIHADAGRERERLRARTDELRSLRYVRAPAELLDDLRQVHAALAGESDAVTATAAAALAFTLYQCGEHEEALAVETEAVAIAERLDATGALLHALGGQATILGELERPYEAIDVARRALALADPRRPRRVPATAGNLAVLLGSVGLYAESADRAREAIAAAERNADRFAERWGRAVLGRSLCSLGEWDEAIAEIQSVRMQLPPFQIGMATAPLVVIALARGQAELARELVDDHDLRCADAGASVFESDFRAIRGLVLVGEDATGEQLAAIVTHAEAADYAEWSGWLAPVVDRLLGEAGRAGDGGDAGDGAPARQLEAALAALRGPGALRQTPPVQAQALRLEARLATLAGEGATAVACLQRARDLAAGCGLAFESAVIDLERVERGVDGAAHTSAQARETFERLAAKPWLARANALPESGTLQASVASGGPSGR